MHVINKNHACYNIMHYLALFFTTSKRHALVHRTCLNLVCKRPVNCEENGLFLACIFPNLVCKWLWQLWTLLFHLSFPSIVDICLFKSLSINNNHWITHYQYLLNCLTNRKGKVQKIIVLFIQNPSKASDKLLTSYL